MEEHTPEFQPLAFLPGRDDRRWCLAMAHGFYYAERQRPDRSSPIFADELRDSGWDYVALGHQHVRNDVSQGDVAAHYAGAPAGEWGDGHSEGMVLRIDFSAEHGIRVRPRPLGDQGSSCETAMVDPGAPSGATRADTSSTSRRA
jgi:DNA repair exonuclease SbcCD nuclease subunit